MAGGGNCNKADPSLCSAFTIQKAELDDSNCEFTTNTTINIEIRGNLHGTAYKARIEVRASGSSKSSSCELKWDDQGSWLSNRIERKENSLRSTGVHRYTARIRKIATTPIGGNFTLTVILSHETQCPGHKIDLYAIPR